MTTQHTLGPWIVSHNAGKQMGGWKTNPYSVVVHPKGAHRTTVANIPDRATISEEQKKANAFLIAAAPELLATLKAAYRHASDRDESLPFDWAVHCEMMHAAIAKATGQT